MSEVDLRNGDCLELMKTIPDGSVDLTVTSPPYDNLRTYNGNCRWEFEGIAKELFRVTKQGGVVVWVVGEATFNGSETGTSFRQALFFKEIGFNLHDTMIYQKPALTFPDTNRYYQDFEYMFVLSKGKPETFNPITDRKNKTHGDKVHGTVREKDGSTSKKVCIGNITKEYGRRFNIWKIPNPGRAGNKHPATFPLKLALDHIVSWSNEGDTILDPFLGSGTTAVAAKSLNRNFIGFELDQTYFDIAQKRIAETLC